MARVLIGWELGGGHGHAVNLVTLARGFAARGHEVVLAMKDPVSVWTVIRDTGFPVLQAPLSLPQKHLIQNARPQPFRARSFADILCVHGYADTDNLEPRARAWRALVDVVKPDLVVSEFAPLLAMVTHGREPCISFGIGFCAPCLADGHFPAFEPMATEITPAARLVESVGRVLERLGGVVPANPLAALVADEQLAIGFDIIDPYRAARATGGVGPMWSVPQGDIALPSKPVCLMYMPAEHPAMATLIKGAAQWKMPTIAYVRGAGRPMIAALRSAGVDVSETPLDLDALMPRISVVLHHAGTGTVERCMAWGRPQVVMPLVLEQDLTSRRLMELGVGRLITSPDETLRLGEIIDSVSRSPDMAAKAQALAGELRQKYPQASRETVIDACLSRLK